MIGLAALGIWMIIAGLKAEAAGILISVGFGIFFILVSLVSLVSCAEVLTSIIRLSRQTGPLLSLDVAGITGLVLVGRRSADESESPIAWSNIASIRLEGSAPGARGSSGLANLSIDHILRLTTKKGLDRTAGSGLGMRDGTRRILVELTDGRHGNLSLTLPIGPGTFSRLAPQIASHARVYNPRILLHGVADV